MDSRCLYRFLKGHLRQYRRHSLREHTLSAAGRAYQQGIVTSCGGNFESLFRGLLTSYVGKVEGLGVSGLGRDVVLAGREELLAAEVENELFGVTYGVDVDAGDDRSLAGIFLRHKDRLHALFTGEHDHWQNSVDAADIAV